MAKAEQLALLRAGVEGWNGRRKEEPGKKIGLATAYLNHGPHEKINLNNADL